MALVISWCLIFSCTAFLTAYYSAALDDRKAYIVYMGDNPTTEISTSNIHVNMLEKVVGSEMAPQSLLHSYKRSFNGFAAKLTQQEANQIQEHEGVVSIFPSERHELHTTRSWDFIGFPEQVKRSGVESDIIIGVIDTGIWPESDSFDDQGFGPPPSKWKGECIVSANFSCNNKIIGAKYYLSGGEFFEGDIKSPRDSNGHGTHTASIAAGGLVQHASLAGLAAGTARGGVPSARLAVYKVCWAFGCEDADILAAFDDAIADGVDVISVSLGSQQKDYFKSVIAIGAFHAMRKGVLTCTSAGNGGPDASSLSNYSPWSLTVGATKMDRDFTTSVRSGNHHIYEGKSINTFDMKEEMFPIISGGDAPNKTSGFDSSFSRYCFEDSLDKNKVKGKIVFCEESGSGALLAGAIGVVTSSRASSRPASSYPLPAALLSLEDSSKLHIYLNSTRKASASISKTKEKIDKFAPYVASYSSRGPNPITSSILKPDLVAPGTYILAAWPASVPLSVYPEDERRTAYNILSGTSMACPHASAAAAYIKSFHPAWSPAAIKSSLMTTANPMKPELNPEAEFAYGAGQVNPTKAVSPGLVYDASEADYVGLLCGQGYTTKLIRIVTGNFNSSCSEIDINDDVASESVNYPALVISASPWEPINRVLKRTVTNVGSPSSKYEAKLVGAVAGVKITVKPNVLRFSSLGEKQSYEVRVQGIMEGKAMVSASLVWGDGTYQVRSPITVYVPIIM